MASQRWAAVGLCLGLGVALAVAMPPPSCVTPTGIDDGSAGQLSSAQLSLPTGQTFISSVFQLIGALTAYETPIQFRLIQAINLAVYSTSAAFHPTALDHFARTQASNDRRRCSGAPLFDLHRDVALAYAVNFATRLHLPEAVETLSQVQAQWGLDMSKCSTPSDCADLSTPWGLAYTLAQESVQFTNNDGWNHDGSLTRSVNRLAYQDPRKDPYVPVNDPWKLTRKSRWQPLLERNGKGYFFHQEHVTPHIGDTARSIFLGDRDICGRSAPDPKYDYREEIAITLQRMAGLTDVKKMEIELFDGKLTSLVPLLVQYYARLGVSLDSYQFIQADSIIISTLYEATIVAWREKVIHDRVRPPSIVHDLLHGKTVNTYAGPYAGIQNIKGEEWEAYIRTMPHSEYPSGSSCVCAAFREAMKELTGADDVTGQIGGPVALDIPAGSSKTEPGAVPAGPLQLVYTTWSAMAETCKQSRLDGGMHFRASIPSGDALCADIGIKMVNAFKALEAGNRPDYVVDFFSSPPIKEERCRKGRPHGN